MPEGASHPRDDRMIIHADLLEKLRIAQRRWIEASNEERDGARARFMITLSAFNSLFLHDKEPTE